MMASNRPMDQLIKINNDDHNQLNGYSLEENLTFPEWLNHFSRVSNFITNNTNDEDPCTSESGNITESIHTH